jgi:hypothetical protein
LIHWWLALNLVGRTTVLSSATAIGRRLKLLDVRIDLQIRLIWWWKNNRLLKKNNWNKLKIQIYFSSLKSKAYNSWFYKIQIQPVTFTIHKAWRVVVNCPSGKYFYIHFLFLKNIFLFIRNQYKPIIQLFHVWIFKVWILKKKLSVEEYYI